ncbi:IcmT/TraK family protein [Zooshikella marina]|uniref:IcmT/TraK family protein n=1 Tax=Zooshikella ganghwensis TaxID=202772 RepID=UPI001BAF109C|nr:IcmT/TraK family protein [Zooshikella ganghwensis]MBU2708703.1 IcmT/TraK family protein [Zooshikella ganghwensis]
MLNRDDEKEAYNTPKGISIWKYASHDETVFGITPVAYAPLFIWLYHWSWTTFYIAAGTIVFFSILRKFGFSFKVIWAKFLHIVRGSIIHARPWWYRNRFRGDI